MKSLKPINSIIRRVVMLLLLLLCLPGLGLAVDFVVERVEWSPQNPDGDDDILMMYDVLMTSSVPMVNEFEFRVNEQTLEINLH